MRRAPSCEVTNDAKDVSALFEPFYRSDHTRTDGPSVLYNRQGRITAARGTSGLQRNAAQAPHKVDPLRFRTA